ncbi:MAG: ferritin family protein [Bacteroidales bacterium]|nr:ferritin family protein [Bacteroidales bacterium]
MKSPEDVLKEAILMEKRGQALYNEVSHKSPDPDVKRIFSLMAEEEAMHAAFLSEQLKSFLKNKNFVKLDLKEEVSTLTELIINTNLKDKIEAASFEGAAISAAIELETKSIEVYKKQAKEAIDPHIKEMFEYLARWENTHYEILLKLDEQLKEKIWFSNEFWPF